MKAHVCIPGSQEPAGRGARGNAKEGTAQTGGKRSISRAADGEPRCCHIGARQRSIDLVVPAVGHNPHPSELVGLLLHQERFIDMKKASGLLLGFDG